MSREVQTQSQQAQGQSQGRDGLRVLFPTLIYEAWYPGYEGVRRGLVDFVRRLREADGAGREKSAQEYSTGYTSYFSRQDLHKAAETAALVKFINGCAEAYAGQHHWDVKNFKPLLNSMWGNINSRYSYHAEHLHPYSHISGVFYVDIPEGSAPISFKDPRSARWMMPPAADGARPENSFHVRVAAEAGKLLLFPAWLEHGVGQHKAEGERISMSFNYEMRRR